jgi:hypothetical protein
MDWESMKGFLTGFITRWVLKLLAGVLVTLGIQEGSAAEVIGAIVTFGLGILISLIQQKKAIETVPPVVTPPSNVP